jgi:hypothetical protein
MVLSNGGTKIGALISVLLCSLLPNSVQSESVNIPLSNLKSADDLSGKLPRSETPQAPEGFGWEGYKGKINISTSILFPYEGQVWIYENMYGSVTHLKS